jgi:type III restriction enzyme
VKGIRLLPVQAQAANQISARFAQLLGDADRPMETARRAVPFYQALSAITGAGKTPILAEAVAQISELLPVQPLVLWISKSKAVVSQTFSNFSAGGKYAHFIKGFVVTNLSQVSSEQIRDSRVACLALATVGTFNQRDKADGTLRVHKTAADRTEVSLWDALRGRQSAEGIRRPLIIVYDEGHNLSDQQVELLLELEPDAILVASATMRISARLGQVIDRFRQAGRNEGDLVTAVPTGPIVERGLVKQQVVLGGYNSSMELVVDELISSWSGATRKAKEIGAGFQPKAIYVCRTNISLDDGAMDNPSRPFSERRAPPILIWRYLVEKQKIEPNTIAVYADLKMDRKAFPAPPDFILFSGGEEDYETFASGSFTHIIFNQSLQEGWDDPSCCFAYIDKSMGSAVQIEQVIGRVLRQPEARIHPDPDLNTAAFFIRLDAKQTFHDVLESVKAKLAKEFPDIKLDSYFSSGKTTRRRLEPKGVHTLPQVHVDSEAALNAIDSIVESIIDYRNDSGQNTFGPGLKMTATVQVGKDSAVVTRVQEVKQSSRILARWLVRRRMLALYPAAAEAVDWAEPKFDARVHLTSPAAKNLERSGEDLVQVYLRECEYVYEEASEYTVGAVYVNDAKLEEFNNSVHAGYSDLNPPELKVARVIDKSGLRWCRNPSNGGYSIPLLEAGEGRSFAPDFIVWTDKGIVLLDPKGGFLLARDSGKKLLDIRGDGTTRPLFIRLISEGKWASVNDKVGANGFTVWTLRAGKPYAKHFADMPEAVAACLGKAF